MKLSIRNIVRKIPIVRRIYISISVRLLKFFDKKNFLIKFKGINYFLNLNDPIDKSIILFDYYENDQLENTLYLISKYKVNIFFDIGAHCGIYSLIIANKYNKINVYSFEPVKTSYRRLLKNISLNPKLKNLNILNYGLSNKNSKLKMKAIIKKNYIQLGGFRVEKEGENIKGHSIISNFKKGDDIFKFRNQTIFLKIDVEGHEFSVLEGFENLFKNNKVLIQIEIFPKNYIRIKKKMNELKFKEKKKIQNDFYFIKKK